MALGKIGTPSAVAILRTLPVSSATAGQSLRRAAEKLAGTGRKSEAAQVYAMLWNPARPSVVRAEAVRGLANIAASNAGSVALAALKSDDPYLQTVAAQVISTMNDPKTTAAALAAWPKLTAPTQTALVTLLGERHDMTAAGIALSAAGSKDSALRMAGIRAAGQIGRRAGGSTPGRCLAAWRGRR